MSKGMYMVVLKLMTKREKIVKDHACAYAVAVKQHTLR